MKADSSPILPRRPPHSLRQLANRLGLKIGAAANPDLIEKHQRYWDTLSREFNCLVAENCMKFMYVQPARGCYNFAPADKLVAFARVHQMRLRGHTLVWHNQLPAWVTQGSYSRTEALDILQEHIFTVMSHFRGQSRAVDCWDVVNEALADDGSWRVKSFWYQSIGCEYVDYAFRWAHEADPDAKLVYNDYGMESPGQKSDAGYRLLRRLRKAGRPVHGVGFQCHLGVENRMDPARCCANFKRFQELGLDLQFTEMDMGIKKPVTSPLYQAQAQEYANRVQIALDTGGVSTLVFWGFTDRYSWIPGFTNGTFAAPLLFDRQYHPKPAYQSIRDVLQAHL